ncbi:HlyD family secretion protein [Spongorhabdus nitratireducens]
MPNIKKLVVLGLVAAVAAGTGGYWWQAGRFMESTDNAYLQSDIVYISTKQAGYAEAGWIQDNQRVEEGDVLARIEDVDYRLKVNEHQAEVASAEAAITQLHSQRQLQQSRIEVAIAELSASKADRDLAVADLERISRLFKKGASSRDALDDARAAERKAGATLQARKASLESTRRQLAVIDSQVNAAQASLQESKTGLAIAQQKLNETIIRAPRTGIIGQRQVKDGQLLKNGSVLFSLVDSDTVWVTANFKETQIGSMQVGQPVTLEIDAFPGEPVTGYIDSLWPASGARFSLLPPENATGNFTKIVQRIPVKIVIPADQPLAGKLRAGMSVVATVDTRAASVDIKALVVTQNNQTSVAADSQQLAGL